MVNNRYYGAMRTRTRGSYRNVNRLAPYVRSGQRLLPYLRRGLQAVGGYMSSQARNRLALMNRPPQINVKQKLIKKRPQINYFTGRSGRNFKRSKRRALKSFGRGSSFYYEYQGVATNSSDQKYPVCIGHSIAYINTIHVVCYALIQLLFKRAGFNIVNWKDPIYLHGGTTTSTRSLRIQWNYSLSSEAASTTSNFDQNTTGNYLDVATNFLNQVLGAITKTTDNVANFNINYIEMLYFNDDAATSSGNIQVFRLNGADIVLDMCMKSVMKMQNRTNSTTEVDHLDDSALNIDRNPLVGRSFDSTGNGFKVRYASSAPGSHKFTGDVSNGVISVVLPGDTAPTAVDEDFVKPPVPNVFANCKKFANVRLNPGQIRTSVLMYKKKMTLTTFLRLMTNMIKFSSDSEAPWVGLGYSRAFFFEKVLNTGVNEPAIDVGYQKEDWLQVVASRKVSRTGPVYTTTV